MPAFDKRWINLIHITTNGNKDADNIFQLCIYRNGLLGQFAFKFWGQRKEMDFALGTTYRIEVEQFKIRKIYGFVITVDDVELVQKSLKDITGRRRPKTYKQVKIYTSNPWQPTMPSKVGAVRNFKIDTGRTQNCCKLVSVRIDKAYLSSSYAGEQKSLVGEYTFKGTINKKSYWIKTDGKQAIWFCSKFKEWSIGSIQYLGTNWRGIAAEHTSATCPTQNQNRWHYFNGKSWKPDLKSHIHIDCKDNFSDFYKENILSKGTYYLSIPEMYSFDCTY